MLQKKMVFSVVSDLERRPLAKLVQEASKFESTIYMEYEDKKVNAKSIMGMMGLFSLISKGSGSNEVNVIVDGGDEAEALAGIEDFLA